MSQASLRLRSEPSTAPSFIDLRAFAALHSGAIARDGGGGDAYLAARRYLELPDGPVAIGCLALDRSEGRVEQTPGDEFIILLAGELTLEPGGARLSLTPGRSAVIPGGRSLGWRAAAGTSALFMRCGGPAGDAAAQILDEAGPLAPSSPPLAELLFGETPQCRNRTDFRSADGQFTCGVWDSTPYQRLPMLYRHYELMHILKGAVDFEADGKRATASAGDIFLVERGAECSWFSEVDVAKVFAIHRPA